MTQRHVDHQLMVAAMHAEHRQQIAAWAEEIAAQRDKEAEDNARRITDTDTGTASNGPA